MSFFSFNTDADNERLDPKLLREKSKTRQKMKKINIKDIIKLDIILYDKPSQKYKCNATTRDKKVIHIFLDADDIYMVMKRLGQEIPEIFIENKHE